MADIPKPIWISNGQTVLYRHGDVEQIVAELERLRERIMAMREALDWCVAEINRDSPAVRNARAVLSGEKP